MREEKKDQKKSESKKDKMDREDKRLQYGAIALAASLTLLFGFFYYLSRTSPSSKSTKEVVALEEVSPTSSPRSSSGKGDGWGNRENEEVDSAGDSEAKEHGNGIISSLHQESLKSVEDDTPLRRLQEVHAWFHIFSLLSATPQGILQKASVGPVLPEMLNDAPEEYRGKVVTVRGRMVLCRKVPCGPNEIGMRYYYEVWMVPQCQGELAMNVCAMEVPELLRSEDAKEKPIEATGIFFKRRAFAKDDRVLQTPVILAKKVRILETLPSETSTRFSAGQVFWIFLLAGILVGGFVLMVRILLRVPGEKTFETEASRKTEAEKPEEIPSSGDTVSGEADVENRDTPAEGEKEAEMQIVDHP
jgi:hypothetical protein